MPWRWLAPARRARRLLSSWRARASKPLPIGVAMRGNLFVYRAADDPWIERMKASPEQELRRMIDRPRPPDRRFRPGRRAGLAVGQSLSERECDSARRGSDRRFVRNRLPRQRLRPRQGLFRRRPPRRLSVRMAGDAGHGRGKDRALSMPIRKSAPPTPPLWRAAANCRKCPSPPACAGGCAAASAFLPGPRAEACARRCRSRRRKSSPSRRIAKPDEARAPYRRHCLASLAMAA